MGAVIPHIIDPFNPIELLGPSCIKSALDTEQGSSIELLHIPP